MHSFQDGWLDEVPRHWDVRRAKWVYREVDDRSVAGDEPLLSVSHLTGVTPRSQKNITMFMAASYAGHKVCSPGDLVINTMWAWMGALGVSRDLGLVSPAYGVYRPLSNSPLLGGYADLLLRTRPYVAEFTRRSTGIQASRLRLYPDDFLRMGLLCPPIAEQIAIVRLLAYFDRRIGEFIRAKQKLSSLVGEERDVLLEEAVRGTTTHTARISAIADVVARPVDRHPDVIYTPIGLFNRGRGMFHKDATAGGELGDSRFFWVKDGDLVLSGQFAWEGAVALARRVDNGCIASHRYPILGAKTGMAGSLYLFALLRSAFGRMLLDQHSRGAAGRNRPLNIRTLLKETVPVPDQQQQQQIAELVDLEVRLDASIAESVRGLREFRARLIEDVVIGRIDVGAIAAELPEDDGASPQPQALFEIEQEDEEPEGSIAGDEE